MSEFVRQNSNLTPLDIIVSCSVCQRSISDIYSNPEQSDGLRQGPNFGNGKITRLWLTECGHLTCTRHLADGGPQFHPSSEKPQAPCPLCTCERGDFSNKTLFWVNGVSSGEYSSEIPKAYFQTPPLRLGGDDPDLEALRFQYLSLLRFGSTQHAKVVRLENKLKIWEDRRPLFKHCVTGFDTLQRELEGARRQLLKLDQDVSSIDQTLKLTSSNPVENGNNVTRQLVNDLTTKETSVSNTSHINTRSRSLLAQASANDLDEINNRSTVIENSSYPPSRKIDYAVGSKRSSDRKRRRIEDDVAHRVPAYQYHQSPTTHSRDAMPPPSVPATIQRTPRTISNAQDDRPTNSPNQRLLPATNVDRDHFSNLNMQGSCSPSYSSIWSGANDLFNTTQYSHGGLVARQWQQHFSPQVSSNQMTPAQVLAQKFGRTSDLTPLRQDQNGIHSYPEEKQGFSLLNSKIQSLNCIQSGSNINPFRQKVLDSEGPDQQRPELNSSFKMIDGADPMVRQVDSNGGFPKTHTNSFAYDRSCSYSEIPYCKRNISRGFIANESEIRRGSHNNFTSLNDGELDQDIIHTSNHLRTTFKTAPIRVSLPPRGPSSVGTPRLRTGMSANARSSNTFRPHREPLKNMEKSNPYVASPYFSDRSIPRLPQSLTPLREPSKSPGWMRTFVEAPFRIGQRSNAGSNRPIYKYTEGRTRFRAGPPAHGAGRGDRSSPFIVRRACR